MDNKFKVGDRVRGINAHYGNEKIVGELGTIIYVFSDGDVSVKFDKDINGTTVTANVSMVMVGIVPLMP